MRNKILMIAAMLAVMVAMTGIASAFNLNIDGGNNPIPLAPADEITLGLTATDVLATDAGDSFTPVYSITCKAANPACNPSDFIITTLTSFGPLTSPTYSESGIFKLTRVSNPVDPNGYQYLLTVTTGPSTSQEFGIATRSIDAIPEFPTVALPVAAVIGLVFFFQNKKKKE